MRSIFCQAAAFDSVFCCDPWHHGLLPTLALYKCVFDLDFGSNFRKIDRFTQNLVQSLLQQSG